MKMEMEKWKKKRGNCECFNDGPIKNNKKREGVAGFYLSLCKKFNYIL